MWDKTGDLSDWWDEQHRAAKDELDQFIEENPNLFGVMVATTFNTAMDVAAPTMDTLRFGKGLAEGGIGGIASDGLRLIGLMGPLGQGGKALQIFSNQKLARVIVDPGGEMCGWVSGTQALRQVGAKAYVSVSDLADEMRMSLSDLAGSNLSSRIRIFKVLGAKVSPMRRISSPEEVEKMTPKDGSVVMIRIAGTKATAQGAREFVAHAVYAFRNFRGEIRFMDRGGSGNPGHVVRSLNELFSDYGVDMWTPTRAAVLENVFGKIMDAAGNAAILAMGLQVATGLSRKGNETIGQAFEIYKKVARRQPVPAQGHYTVVAGDSLPKVADALYGDKSKWPVIYEANRGNVGKNFILVPQKRLAIPDLPRVKEFGSPSDGPVQRGSSSQSSPFTQTEGQQSAPNKGVPSFVVGIPHAAPPNTDAGLGFSVSTGSDHPPASVDAPNDDGAPSFEAQISINALTRLLADANVAMENLRVEPSRRTLNDAQRAGLNLERIESLAPAMGDSSHARGIIEEALSLRRSYEDNLREAESEHQRQLKQHAEQREQLERDIALRKKDDELQRRQNENGHREQNGEEHQGTDTVERAKKDQLKGDRIEREEKHRLKGVARRNEGEERDRIDRERARPDEEVRSRLEKERIQRDQLRPGELESRDDEREPTKEAQLRNEHKRKSGDAEARARNDTEVPKHKEIEDYRREAEKARLRDEEARRREADEALIRQETEARQREAEKARIQDEEARRREADEALIRQETEARQREAEKARIRDEEARRREADEALIRQETEARQREAEKARIRDEEARRREADEALIRQETEARQREAEKARIRDEEARRREADEALIRQETEDPIPDDEEDPIHDDVEDPIREEGEENEENLFREGEEEEEEEQEEEEEEEEENHFREEQEGRIREEDNRRAAEEARIREEKEEKEEKEVRKREEDRRHQIEETRRREREDAGRREAEEIRKLDVEDAGRRIAEESRRREDEDARRGIAEESRRREDEDARRRIAEESRRREDEDARRRIAEESRRREDEDAARRKAEEMRRREDEDAARRKAEEIRRREDEDIRRREEEEIRRHEEEEARKSLYGEIIRR